MKLITPQLPTSLTDAQLSALNSITGKPIYAQTLPFLGRTVVYDGKRHASRLAGDLPSTARFEVSLEQREATKEVTHFYIGSTHHGPVLSVEVRDDGVEWYNCYAKTPGGWGQNCTCGGTWATQARSTPAATWQDALDRRYDPALVLGGEAGVDSLKFKESPEFLASLAEFLATHA